MIKGTFLLISRNVPFYMVVILIKVDVVSKNKTTSLTCDTVLCYNSKKGKFEVYYTILICTVHLRD